jgi:hypothetical protein
MKAIKVARPDKFLPVPTRTIAAFGILPTFRKVGAGDGILSSMAIKGTLPVLILGVLLTAYVRLGYAHSTSGLRTWLEDRALQSIDKSDQFYYASVHPYLEEPVKKLVKRIPELKSMQPAPDQQALPMIVEKTGKTIDDFFHNIVDLIAREKITQENLTNTEVGRAEGYSTPRDVGARTSESVQDDYLIVRTGNGVQQGIVEYRMDAKGNRLDEWRLNTGYPVTIGFALSCIYFSTGLQSESTFRYLGEQRIGTRDTYVVAFAQRPGDATISVTVRGQYGEIVHLLVQGVAWVDKNNFQIVRMRTDLLAPRPDIKWDEQTTEVTFSEVRLLDVPYPLWLPNDVKVNMTFNGHNFRNEHHYTKYRRYRVAVKMDAPQ